MSSETSLTAPWLTSYDEGVPHTIEIPPLSLYALLSEAAQRFPQATAIEFYEHKLSYSELDSAVVQLARGLATAGLHPGERVVLLMPNTPNLVIACYAVWAAGGIVVPCDPREPVEEIMRRIRETGAETIIALSIFHPQIRQMRTMLAPAQPRVIYTNIKEYLPNFQRQLFNLLRQEREGHRVPADEARQSLWLKRLSEQGARGGRLPEVQAEDVAAILYTSGTLAAPRGTVHTHRSLHANALQVRAWYSDAQPGHERLLGLVPFSFSYGLTACMNLAISLTSTLLLVPSFDLPQVLTAIKHEQPTFFPGTPPMYAALNTVRNLRKTGMGELKVCLSGGAPLPIEVQEGFERLTRCRLVEGYGLAEAGPVTHANPLIGKRRAGWIGLPLPNTEACIVDPQTLAPVAVGQIGEMLVRGPQVMQGYWRLPEDTARALIGDGWLRTGDLARMNAAGWFQVIDRVADVILRDGVAIYPRDIEEALYEHPQVLEAAVLGIPDAEGTSIHAFIVPEPGEKPTINDLLAFARRRLGVHEMPQHIHLCERLPRSLAGKVLRRILAGEAR